MVKITTCFPMQVEIINGRIQIFWMPKTMIKKQQISRILYIYISFPARQNCTLRCYTLIHVDLLPRIMLLCVYTMTYILWTSNLIFTLRDECIFLSLLKSICGLCDSTMSLVWSENYISTLCTITRCI